MKSLICKCLFIILLTSFLLTACTREFDKVKLLTEKQAVGMANRKYGDAEFVKDADKTDNSIIYYFKDTEYGFDYTLKTFVDIVSIDGSEYGYREEHVSNFDDQYKRFLLKEAVKEDNDFCILNYDVEDDYYFIPFRENMDDVVLEYEENDKVAYFSIYHDYRSFNMSDTFVFCYSTDKDIALNGSEKLSRIINELDHRKYFLSEKIPIHIAARKINTENEYDIEFFKSVSLSDN